MTRAGSSAVAAASSCGSSARVRKNGDFTLRSSTLSQASAGNSASGAPHVAPALFTRMWSLLSRAAISAARSMHAASVARSAGRLTQVPTFESSAATSSHTSFLRDEM